MKTKRPGFNITRMEGKGAPGRLKDRGRERERSLHPRQVAFPSQPSLFLSLPLPLLLQGGCGRSPLSSVQVVGLGFGSLGLRTFSCHRNQSEDQD